MMRWLLAAGARRALRAATHRPADAATGFIIQAAAALPAREPERQPPCLPIAPNRLPTATPDAVWVADITYVPTDEGWLYVKLFTVFLA